MVDKNDIYNYYLDWFKYICQDVLILMILSGLGYQDNHYVK